MDNENKFILAIGILVIFLSGIAGYYIYEFTHQSYNEGVSAGTIIGAKNERASIEAQLQAGWVFDTSMCNSFASTTCKGKWLSPLDTQTVKNRKGSNQKNPNTISNPPVVP